MASSKNASEFTLPSFENSLSLDSGLSITSSTLFADKCRYGLKTSDDRFSVPYATYIFSYPLQYLECLPEFSIGRGRDNEDSGCPLVDGNMLLLVCCTIRHATDQIAS